MHSGESQESQSRVCRTTGYEHPVEAVVEDLLACLDDPRLPLLQWNELYAVAQSRLPPDLVTLLEHIVGKALFTCQMSFPVDRYSSW